MGQINTDMSVIAEANYAWQLQKNIIFCRVERNFRPTGPLGLMLGTSLYIDFSGKYEYEVSKRNLLTKLGELQGRKNSGHIQPSTATPVLTVSINILRKSNCFESVLVS